MTLPPSLPLRRRRLVPLLLLVAISLGAAASAEARDPSQDVRVIDGDTLQIDGAVVQIYGIDAPELGQLCYPGEKPRPCGLEAALALNKIVELAREPLSCRPIEGGTGESGEVCELGGQVIAEVLASQGYVVAIENGAAAYHEAQATARKAKLGIWGGEFVMPWRWRAGERLVTDSVEVERCNVKAVVRDGVKTYYVPLDPGYASLQLDLVRGDQMFCSDEAARQHGWKHDGAVVDAR